MKLSFFADRIADGIAQTARTGQRDWVKARALLPRALSDQAEPCRTSASVGRTCRPIVGACSSRCSTTRDRSRSKCFVVTARFYRADERFPAEIRLTANLRYPNIVPLFDSGDADGWPLFVMPYIDVLLCDSSRPRRRRNARLTADSRCRAVALDAQRRNGVGALLIRLLRGQGPVALGSWRTSPS